MGVTRDDVLHVARLARLRLEPEEVAQFTEQLNGILEHMAALQQLPEGDEIETVAGAAPLRPDEPGADTLLRDPAELAPAWLEGFFTVPKLDAMEVDEGLEAGG